MLERQESVLSLPGPSESGRELPCSELQVALPMHQPDNGYAFDHKDHLPERMLSFVLGAGYKLERSTMKLAWDYSCFRVHQEGYNKNLEAHMMTLTNVVSNLDNWKMAMNSYGECTVAKLNELECLTNAVTNSCRVEFEALKKLCSEIEENLKWATKTAKSQAASFRGIEERLSRIERYLESNTEDAKLSVLRERIDGQVRLIMDQQEASSRAWQDMIGPIQNQLAGLESSLANNIVGSQSSDIEPLEKELEEKLKEIEARHEANRIKWESTIEKTVNRLSSLEKTVSEHSCQSNAPEVALEELRSTGKEKLVKAIYPHGAIQDSVLKRIIADHMSKPLESVKIVTEREAQGRTEYSWPCDRINEGYRKNGKHRQHREKWRDIGSWENRDGAKKSWARERSHYYKEDKWRKGNQARYWTQPREWKQRGHEKWNAPEESDQSRSKESMSEYHLQNVSTLDKQYESLQENYWKEMFRETREKMIEEYVRGIGKKWEQIIEDTLDDTYGEVKQRMMKKVARQEEQGGDREGVRKKAEGIRRNAVMTTPNRAPKEAPYKSAPDSAIGAQGQVPRVPRKDYRNFF